MGKRIELEDLIEAGVIKPKSPIHAKFKGQSFFAEIDGDGFVLLEGRWDGPGHGIRQAG